MYFQSELSFRVFYTKHQHARALCRSSNSNQLVGSLCLTFSVRRLNLRNLSLHCNRHIHNFVSVLVLRNFDVLGLVLLGVFGLLVDLLQGDGFRFFCANFLMIRDSSSTLLTTCSTRLPCDRRAAPLPCLSEDLSFVTSQCSVIVRDFAPVGRCSGPPTAFRRNGPSVPGCPCPGPLG